MTTNPSPQTWTLRFKNQRTTVVLHVDPLQSLSSIKTELLKAIRESALNTNTFNGATIPHNANEILLARPRDINDLSAGWESIDGGASDIADNGKGKGKVNAASTAVARKAATENARSVGLRDGGMVAFKFRAEAEKTVRALNDIDDDDGEEIRIDEEDEDQESWDVVVPTMEETYGDGMPATEPMEEDGP